MQMQMQMQTQMQMQMQMHKKKNQKRITSKISKFNLIGLYCTVLYCTVTQLNSTRFTIHKIQNCTVPTSLIFNSIQFNSIRRMTRQYFKKNTTAVLFYRAVCMYVCMQCNSNNEIPHYTLFYYRYVANSRSGHPNSESNLLYLLSYTSLLLQADE